MFENYIQKKDVNLISTGLWEMTFEDGSLLASGNKVMWTEAFRKLLGFSNESDFPGVLESWISRIHSDDRERVLQAFTSHVGDYSGQTSFDEQYRLCLKNNQYRWFRTVGDTVRNEQGVPLRFTGSSFYIHDQRKKEQEMEFMIIRFELISRALTEGPWDMEVVAGDPINPTNVIWWSPQFRNLIGYSDEDDFPNVLSSWSNRLHPEDKEMALNAVFDHLNDYSGNTPYSNDYRLCLKNGEYRWFHAHGYTLRDEQGVPLRVAGTIRDIEHERQKAKDSEAKLNRYCEIVNTLTKKQGLDPNLTFVSSEMKELVKSIEKYAKVDAPILITGESGVGKEVVTDLIHNFSDRKEAPFLKINCGAIPEALLESELFGYDEGAFSGAKKGGKIGFFELADNGTVLLDEIGDLPLQLQVKLLRFVQNHDFYKIGGKRLIKVNTRIVAATNRDLESMVQNKEFRSDLFYRLHVLTIHIPALRERPSDIIPLTNYFLNKFNETYHTSKTLSPEVYKIFSKYLWPGNVRELENLMERLIVTAEMDTITSECIPQAIRNFVIDTKTNNVSRSIITYKQAKEQFERQYFQQAIEKYGSTRKAAEQIEVDHSTIVKKASKYGIDLLHWRR
ncbi:sigma 54-interacting transcriptional regulator [Desulfosporosinus sp. OT]|uniref:sigma 54-interacting transcriptional regulator n=1 Tax=Desulfosporosinus sp. OT TaxID=913865 RepID=UPI001300C99D|nr:sigma 54-interacting transcriptional regulator [Desulfosporosinus sp. OT]